MNTRIYAVSGSSNTGRRTRSARRSRALVAAGAITGVMLLATAMTAPAASADSAGVTARTTSAESATVARTAADLPVYRDWYWSYAACDNAGRQGVERGHWGAYQCAEGDMFWHLWTDR